MSVRDRNESAWLLPNDGTRTNHRLRRDMRRHADADEVDIVDRRVRRRRRVLAQRLARAGWSVVALDAGPFWDPDPTGSATRPARTTSTGPSRASSAAATRCRSGRTTPAAASAARWCTTPGTPAASTQSTSERPHCDGVGADWPIAYDDLKPYYEQLERELPVAGQDWPWGDPHAYRTRRTRSAATARSRPRRAAAGHRGPGRAGGDQQRPVRQPAALHLPRLLPAGLQGQREGVAADHARAGRARARRRGPRGQHGHAVGGRRSGPATGVRYVRGGVERFQRRRDGRRRRLLDRDAPAAAQLGQPPLPDGWQRLRPGRPLPDGAGRPQTAGRLRRGVRTYKAPPPEVSTEQFYETDPGKPYRRGFSIQTSRRCRSRGPSTCARRALGRALREYMRDYVHWSTLGRCASSCRCRTTGSRWPTRATGTACRSRSSPTPVRQRPR
jgi:choline dehydrogenase-like flavoprotein